MPPPHLSCRPAADQARPLAVPAEAANATAAMLDSFGIPAGTRYAALMPAASGPAVQYSAELFGRVAAGLADSGLPVVVAGSDREAEAVGDVVGTAGRNQVLGVCGLDAPRFTALLAAAAVAVVNDCAAMRLTDAVGTPAVCAQCLDLQPAQLSGAAFGLTRPRTPRLRLVAGL